MSMKKRKQLFREPFIVTPVGFDNAQDVQKIILKEWNNIGTQILRSL